MRYHECVADAPPSLGAAIQACGLLALIACVLFQHVLLLCRAEPSREQVIGVVVADSRSWRRGTFRRLCTPCAMNKSLRSEHDEANTTAVKPL